ncbi:uncharacterized protein LOC110377159 [Helicoverpa armigera]|uniref:uncharacterized protein LOC110377159 n=1 Tax=Helicoverpa armigera TaxID=29058 RepID=UPI0030828FDE
MLKCFYILIWIAVFKLSFCQQRTGHESVAGKNYLVYFVKSPYTKIDDKSWICAGAIVTPTQILTAASCLTEMQKIYAIAGYKKYVHGVDIDKDNCTSRYKKKVVKISVPKEYTIDATAKQPDWISIDIGIAHVQEPYRFSDMSYRMYCSYVPQSIIINFEKNNMLETNQAVALGWGGKQDESSKDIFLQEANTTIIEKRMCSNLLSSPESMELIEKYMLCASGEGQEAEDGLGTTAVSVSDDCPPDSSDPICFDDFKFRRLDINSTSLREIISRRSTVKSCQYDHGGPLISWIGTQEVILGVALNGVAKAGFHCTGPRMYVSTAETETIIKCLLEQNEMRRNTCNEKTEDQKYQVVDIVMKWPEDVAFNLSTLLTKPKGSLFLRKRNEEQPLQVRPTKDLVKNGDQGNPSQLREPVYNQNDQKPADSFYINQDQGQEAPSAQYGNQQGQMQQSPTDLQNQPVADPYNQAQVGSFNQPPADAYNQQIAPYNPPKVDTYAQQNDPYGQSQSFNQPQMESFNQQPADPFNTQPMDSFNPPSMDSYNQSPMETQNQPPVDLNNQPQYQSQSSFNPPQDFYNQPDAQQPPQVDSYNQQQTASFKPALGNGNIKPEMDAYKQAQRDLYSHGNQPQTQFKQPQAESEPKIEPFSQTKNSFQDPPIQSPFNNPDIEPFKQSAASDTYNPLSIISENQPDELDPFKIPVDEPFKASPVEPYKHPSSDSSYKKQEPFKPAPVEPYGQPNVHQVDSGRPFDQTHVQPGEQQHVEPFGQLQMQETPTTTDPSQSRSFLRYQQQGSDMRMEQDPSQDNSQTFEQMYSQLHAGGSSSFSENAPVTEQTFEEMYKTLHDDGSQDAEREPKGEQSFGMKNADQPTYQEDFNQPTMEQPSASQPERQFGQPSSDRPQYGQPSFNEPQIGQLPLNIPQFDPPTLNQPAVDQQSFQNKQPEQQYDRNSNVPQAAEDRGEVKVRPQMPLEYPDYITYNNQRRKDI